MNKEHLGLIYRNLRLLDELNILLGRHEDGFVRRLLDKAGSEMRRDIERHVENGDTLKYLQPTRWTL